MGIRDISRLIFGRQSTTTVSYADAATTLQNIPVVERAPEINRAAALQNGNRRAQIPIQRPANLRRGVFRHNRNNARINRQDTPHALPIGVIEESHQLST